MPYAPPKSLAEDVGAAHPEEGWELETLASWEGSYRLSLFYSALLWPRFEIYGPYILRQGGYSPESIKQWEAYPSSDRRLVEATLNHLHLTDYFNHSGSVADPDILKFLLKQMHEVYEAKLQWQFPERPCQVESVIPINEDDLTDYQITFWQK